VIVAVWLVTSLPLEALRWLVLVVVFYASVTLLRAGIRGNTTAKPTKLKNEKKTGISKDYED